MIPVILLIRDVPVPSVESHEVGGLPALLLPGGLVDVVVGVLVDVLEDVFYATLAPVPVRAPDGLLEVLALEGALLAQGGHEVRGSQLL